MKRFWTKAEAVEADGGWTVALDGRPVRTPAGRPLALPTEALARGVADEWAGVEGELQPGRLRLTGLANAAVDRIAPDAAAFAATLASYADTDLLCYRAEGPTELIERQAAGWDAALDAFADRHGVDFVRVTGVIPQPQPALTRDVLLRRLGKRDAFALAGAATLVTTTGSLVLALLLADHGWNAEPGWSAATLDERWQAEQWGSDEEAEARLTDLRRQYDAALRLLELSKATPRSR